MVSFLKWVGGKRWLLPKVTDLIPDMASINNYWEPFLGGGSMFFHMQPKFAILSDTNADLINAYKVVRDSWEPLIEKLYKYQFLHSKKFYYEMRAAYAKTPIEQAARFIYLNRTCWNGLYRVNKKGEFNVPIGSKTNVILTTDDFQTLSYALNSTDLLVCDFETTVDKAQKDDFIFVDPPYTVKHNLNGFVKYNENIFSWQDQIRLQKSLCRAAERGVKILLTNANHKSIIDLYSGFGQIIPIERTSVIAGKSTARGVYTELAIKC